MIRAVLALAVVVLIAAPARAEPDAAGEAFRAATRLVADGDHAAAQAAFEAVVALDPAGPWADDALAEAAGAAERRGALDDARRLWRRVLAEHPSSRQSRRARARVAALEQAIGPGGEWLAVAEAHERIVRGATGEQDPRGAIAALEALVAAHPGYPRAHAARIWIGEAWLRAGFPGRAAQVFRDARARATAPADRWRAGKALGDALAASGDLDAAEAQYRAMIGEGDALADGALAGALDEVATMRLRAHLVIAAWAALALALALLAAHLLWTTRDVRAAARALVRPPLEVWFFLPVAAMILFAALSGNFLVERAVRVILIGGLAVTWLSGTSLEVARARGRLRAVSVVVHLAAIVIAVAAIGYLAVMNDRLIDMLRETWSHGHEGR